MISSVLLGKNVKIQIQDTDKHIDKERWCPAMAGIENGDNFLIHEIIYYDFFPVVILKNLDGTLIDGPPIHFKHCQII
jgi:hypothetical protein